MQGLTVRRAEPSELDATGDLCAKAYVAGGHLLATDPYAETLRNAQARSHSTVILVAMRGDRMVGTVTLCPPGSPWREAARDGESEFRFLAVDPDAWRTGVGEALVSACEDFARDQGLHAQVIFVIDRNPAARDFYLRLGFERFDERDWEPVPGVLLQAFRRPVPYGD